MSKKSLKASNNQSLSEFIEAQVILSSETCSSETDLTLAQICGSDFWAEFDRGESTRFGSLMKKLVSSKRVPFIFVRTNSKNHALYRLSNEEV